MWFSVFIGIFDGLGFAGLVLTRFHDLSKIKELTMSSSTRVFIGLLLGVVVGLLLGNFAPDWVPKARSIAQPIGKLWLNALQMTIVPLVASLLIVGINQASDIAESGRVARRAPRLSARSH